MWPNRAPLSVLVDDYSHYSPTNTSSQRIYRTALRRLTTAARQRFNLTNQLCRGWAESNEFEFSFVDFEAQLADFPERFASSEQFSAAATSNLALKPFARVMCAPPVAALPNQTEAEGIPAVRCDSTHSTVTSPQRPDPSFVSVHQPVVSCINPHCTDAVSAPHCTGEYSQ